MDEDNLPIPAIPTHTTVYGEIQRPIPIAAPDAFQQQIIPESARLDLPEGSSIEARKQEELVKEIELRRQMKNLVVPTDDGKVRSTLRTLGEPITLFGEREMERRDRLRKLLATMNDQQATALATAHMEQEQAAAAAAATSAPPPDQLFYTEGSQELADARLSIAKWSLKRASYRVAHSKLLQKHTSIKEQCQKDEAVVSKVKTITQSSSEIADDRPIIACHFSPDGKHIATGSWSGCVKVWSSPECRNVLTIKAHTDYHRVTGVAWHPFNANGASISRVDNNDNESNVPIIASGATDKTAKLWSSSGKLVQTLTGHTDRLGRVAFHPMGCHLGTASFDQTWRLWDIETGACLVEQEGHSRGVYSIAFQCDGSLAVSGGLDGWGRVWDVRTGKSIFTLEGHIKSVLAVDFSPNGYMVATGSEDNTARVWDLRKKGTLAVLPGHTSLVCCVKFDTSSEGEGRLLMTVGYDNLVKLWCGRKFRLAKSLAGHEGKVMSGDVCPDGSFLLATGGYDRTLKLWEPRLGRGVYNEPMAVE